MISVRGTFRNGSAQPEAVVQGREGQPVIITFLEDGRGPDEQRQKEMGSNLCLILPSIIRKILSIHRPN